MTSKGTKMYPKSLLGWPISHGTNRQGILLSSHKACNLPPDVIQIILEFRDFARLKAESVSSVLPEWLNVKTREFSSTQAGIS